MIKRFFESEPHPHNECVEDGNDYRILSKGTEIATLHYCEDWRIAQLYAKAPELVRALRELMEAVEGHERRTGCDQWHPSIAQARQVLDMIPRCHPPSRIA